MAKHTENLALQAALNTFLEKLGDKEDYCQVLKECDLFPKDFLFAIDAWQSSNNLSVFPKMSEYYSWKGKLEKVLGKISTHPDLSMDVMVFAKVFPYLLNCGMSLLECIEQTSTLLEEDKYQQALTVVNSELEKGERLNESLTKTNLFPTSLCQTVAFGDEVGQIEAMLKYILLDLEIEFAGESISS